MGKTNVTKRDIRCNLRKRMGCECKKDVRIILSTHIFQLMLVNGVNKMGVKTM